VTLYADTPVTRASGKTKAVMHRRVKNQRLAAAGYVWAFSAITASPGARAHYDRRKDAADRHAAAQRNLFASSAAWSPASTTTSTPPSPPARKCPQQADAKSSPQQLDN